MINRLGLCPYNHLPLTTRVVEGVADLMLLLLYPTDSRGCVRKVPRRNAITK